MTASPNDRHIRWIKWTRPASLVVAANVGYALVGMAAIAFEHEGPVRVVIAWLVGLSGAALARVAWTCARSGRLLPARVFAVGASGTCGAVLLVTAVKLIGGAWGGSGVITDAQFAEVHIGETKSAVHDALGEPLQHLAAGPDLQQWLGDAAGEDCDVYEKDPGLQGGMYAHVCYVDGKVTRIVPFV